MHPCLSDVYARSKHGRGRVILGWEQCHQYCPVFDVTRVT